MIECIPNFSEGRRQDVIDSIAATIAGVPGATVLDIHADADHNRSVITFAGAAGAVAEAAFQAVRVAAALEDSVRNKGAVPATIGILSGKILVGMKRKELEQLASTPHVSKLNLSNFAANLAAGVSGFRPRAYSIRLGMPSLVPT